MPKDTFNNISDEKRKRVLTEAARLFALRGYDQTDTSELARRAKISKGSLYDYFVDKEDLYLTVCRDGLERHRRAVYGDIEPHWSIFRQVEHIFRCGAAFAQSYPEYVAMYLSVSSAGMDRFAEKLSLEVEKFTADHFKRLIRWGMELGSIRRDIDVCLAAFTINSLYIVFLASLVSRHYQIRIKEYLEIEGEVTFEAVQKYLDRTILMIHQFLSPGVTRSEG